MAHIHEARGQTTNKFFCMTYASEAINQLPVLPASYVFRQHIVDAATTLAIAQGTLLIQGDEGIGISSFLSELTRNSKYTCLYLHVKSASRITYTVPYLIAQLMPQLCALIGDSTPDEGLHGVADWRKAVMRLQQFARRNGAGILFIVDGLGQVPDVDAKYVDEIVADLLCLGITEIKHLISVNRNVALQKKLAQRGSCKDFELMPLSREEARSVLLANGLQDSEIDDVLASARGNPGVLASACRLIKDGARSPSQPNAGLMEFLRHEWQRFIAGLSPQEKEIAQNLYANLLFSRQSFDQEALGSRVLDSAELLHRIVEQQKFVRLSESGVIEIAGSTARKLLESELHAQRSRVIQENIALLIQEPTSKAAVELLPSFYDEAGNTRELLAYLSPEVLDLWFEQTGSLNLLQRRTLLGLEAASSAKLVPEIFRFSLETSAVRCLKQGVDETKSRIALLAEMGNYTKALELTQEGPTSESRTILLAEYVRIAHRKKQPIDPLAREHLAEAISGLDEKADQELALDLATAIVGAFPDLAVAAVDKGLRGSAQKRDVMLGRLAMETISAGGSLHRTYAERIADSKLQAFVITLGELLGGKTLEGIRQIVSDMPTRQKFLFLRNWLEGRPNNPESVDVAAYTLSEIERESTYTPTAADFCDIVQPAIRSATLSTAKALLQRIESQVGLVKAHSSSVDLVRLQLYLAVAAVSSEPLELVESRLLDVVYAIQDIGDIGTKLEATAWTLTILGQFEVPPVLDARHKFHALLSNDMLRDATEVLSNTAEHFEVAQGALRALCEKYPDMALALVDKFNTQDRRDEGYAEVAEYIVRYGEPATYVSFAVKCIERICSASQRAQAVMGFIKGLSQRPAVQDNEFQTLLELVQTVSDPGVRSDVYVLLCGNPFFTSHPAELDAVFANFIDVVVKADDLTLLRPRVFRMLQAFASAQKDGAITAYSKAEQVLSEYAPAPRALAVTNYYFAKIASSSFIALAAQNLDSEQHLVRLTKHLESIPVFRWRVMLLNDLAIGLHYAGRRDLRDRVCAERMLVMVSSMEEEFPGQYEAIVSEALPSLYLWKESVARSFLKKFSGRAKEDALVEIAWTLLRGTSLLNPYNDETLNHRELSYDEALTVVELLEQLTVDSAFVRTAEGLVSALGNHLNRGSFTSQQRQAFATRLTNHATRILPDQRNIKHEGWLILVEMKISSLGDLKTLDWKVFERRIDAIPNLSDQVLLYGELASLLPQRLDQQKKSLIKKAEACLAKVPSVLDRALRAVNLSASAGATDKELAEKLLRDALEISLKTDSNEAAAIRKHIIDAAYRLDDRVAERLVERIDDDPARAKAKREVKAQLAVHRTSKAIGQADLKGMESAPSSFGESSMRALGSLYAHRSSPMDAAKSIAVVSQAATGTLEANWAAYCWFIKSASLRAQKHPEKVAPLLTAFHEMIQLSAELAARLTSRLCGEAHQRLPAAAPMSDYALGDHGTRKKVLNSIVGWLSEDAADEIVLCDPYFKPAAMELVWMLHAVRPDLAYCVLTHLQSATEADKLRASLFEQWRALTDDACPPVAIVGCHFEDRIDQCPVHDRWILGTSRGAQLGTSIADIGTGRLSAADKLDAAEVGAVREKLNRYLLRGKRHTDGRTLRYVLTSI
jgi:hypothetical protein